MRMSQKIYLVRLYVFFTYKKLNIEFAVGEVDSAHIPPSNSSRQHCASLLRLTDHNVLSPSAMSLARSGTHTTSSGRVDGDMVISIHRSSDLSIASFLHPWIPIARSQQASRSSNSESEDNGPPEISTRSPSTIRSIMGCV